MSMIAKKIVVPVDFSEQSEAAVRRALEIVERGGEVTVVHVLSPLHPVEPGVVWHTIDNDARIHSVKLALDERFPEPRDDELRFDVRIGDAGQEIVETAKELEAELIVIPSHGRTGIGRLLIGSVAERVVRLAQCPVLVLRS